MDAHSGVPKRTHSQVAPPTESRVGASRRQELTLAFVPDDLDDATHRRQDEYVLEMCKDVPMMRSSSLLAANYLSVIASACERLHRTYKELEQARALLDDNPQLMSLLWDSLESGTFRKVRTLREISLF
jgi:hypothetical protein